MSKEKLDMVSLGNAIVDVLSYVDDAFLQENAIEKGIMTLVSADTAKSIYDKLGSCIEVSGGSAANTAVVLSSLGGKAGYIGKVADDNLGKIFEHDIKSTGVEYSARPLAADKNIPTSHCMVMVTPDAHRTMCTALGASTYVSGEDLNADLIARADVTYLEGYLFDKEEAKQAFVKAAEIAHAAGKKIALTLSDPFCVERHRDAFLHLVKGHVDILFANEAEIESLYKGGDFSDAAKHCDIVVVTRSEKGSLILNKEDRVEVAASTNNGLVADTTGAGDAYAAGFIYGYTRGKSLEDCGKIGSLVAGEIISHLGARPQRPLIKLLQENNLV